MKKIHFMLTAFRDGFQSVYGARVFSRDYLPSVAFAAHECGITHLEAGGGAMFQSPFFYCNENAFDVMDAFRAAAGPEFHVINHGEAYRWRNSPKAVMNMIWWRDVHESLDSEWGACELARSFDRTAACAATARRSSSLPTQAKTTLAPVAASRGVAAVRPAYSAAHCADFAAVRL